jgi:hypothetical protein
MYGINDQNTTPGVAHQAVFQAIKPLSSQSVASAVADADGQDRVAGGARIDD